MTNTIGKEETNSEEKEQNPILEKAAEMTEEETIGSIGNYQDCNNSSVYWQIRNILDLWYKQLLVILTAPIIPENGLVDPGNVQITGNTVVEEVEEGTDTVLQDPRKWHLQWKE